jgi:hypothetical protein
MTGQFIAEFSGSIIGAMLIIYLICKAIEWVVLKRIGTSQSSMVLTSTSITFLLLAALWVSGLGTPTAKGPSFLLAIFFGAVILAIIRLKKIKPS